MLGVIAAEWLKLRKRPAVWVCFAIIVALLILLGYLLTYFIYTYTKPPTTRGPALDYSLLKTALYPAHFHQNTMGGGAQLGGVIALIVGVLAQGSEYGWATVKTAFTQRPRRSEVVVGRLVVLSGLTLLLAVVLLALGALVSWILVTIDGRSSTFPDWETIGRAVLALWLIYSFWALFGFTLATLFQQSALAIGLGLAYALVIEALIFGLADQFVGDASRRIHQWFPLENMSFLVLSFGRAAPAEAAGGTVSPPFADGTHGVVVLLVYCAALAALSLLLTQRRDVT